MAQLPSEAYRISRRHHPVFAMNFPDPNLSPIVIVDDCEDDAFMLRHRLRRGEITNPVTTFSSCAGALAYLTGLYGVGAPPQVLFVDIKMPEAGTLIAGLRDDVRFDETKIVVATYSNDPVDLKRALDLHVDGYILKFPDADILAQFVQHGPWFTGARRGAAVDALCA